MTDRIQTLIVDDEPLARETLRDSLKEMDCISICGEAENGYQAVKMVHQLRPDLLLLDINMPRLDGFDVIELLGSEVPGVIFITAHDEYALRAFEAQAVDYLLKPVRKERLVAALERFSSMKKNREPVMDKLIEAHHNEQSPLNRILIRDQGNVYIIPTEEIMFIEAQDDYVAVHSEENSHLKQERMQHLEQQLDPKVFCRIHRSYILNTAFLKKIEPYSKDSRIAILKNGKTLPISRSGYERLMKLF